MGNDGIFIADSEPDITGKVTWLKINPDGSREWYEKVDDDFTLVKSEPTPVSADHTHAEHGDINFTGNIQADGYDGLNERVTIGTKKLTFKEGICIGVEDV